MEITEVKIYPIKKDKEEKKLMAYASIVFDSVFIVRGIKVISGKDGLFVVMPSRKLPDGTYKDIAHPLNNEFMQLIQKLVLAEYDKLPKEQVV
ncbi:MAG: septation protein SpoVG family protein [bacterium]